MKRKLYALTLCVLLGASVGSAVANAQMGQLNWGSTIGGLTDGGLIAFALAFYHWFIYRGLAQEFFKRRPFGMILIIQFTTYMILIVAMRTIGRFVTGGYNTITDIWNDPHAIESIVLAAVIALFLNFLIYVTALLDIPTITAFLSGRYHRPRREHRVFLFVDLVGSTTIAEQIGGEKFALMLDWFFSDMTDALLRTGGAIYKYVGDEAIISWRMKHSAAPSSVLCQSLIKAEIQKNRERYQTEFGIVPQFRAAAHSGEVIACEIGTLKKEIAFLGDTVNVTARLLDESRKAASNFVISGALVELLSTEARKGLENMGNITVRGRNEPIEVYSV